MAAWQTPVTSWVATNYYNFGDLDRVEQNTEYLRDEFLLLGYGAATTTFVYPRTRTSFNQYKTDLNRIENNIKALADATWEPVGWTTPITDWASVSQGFGFADAIRLEQNLLYLYNMLQNLEDAYLYCGDAQASICGKGNTLF